MDYKRVLRLHFVNHLSGREIAESCGDCSKTTVNEFLKRFRECPELTYPLSEDVTNEYIAGLLYKKSGIAADQLLYRDFNKEAVYKALARKGETLKHLWQKYNAIGIVDGKKPMSYRQYCRRHSEWADSKQLTFHIQRYPGVNLELDYAGKQLYLHNRRNPEETTKVTIFIAALTYSDYFYAEGMTECDIKNWIRVNNNALAYFGGVTPTVTPDNCKVAVAKNKDWISPVLNKDFQAWAEHIRYCSDTGQGQGTTLEAGCRRACKDRYHAHSCRHGRYDLLLTGRLFCPLHPIASNILNGRLLK